MSDSESEKRKIELGPLFTSGAVVLAYGLLRRRRLALVIGLGAIWLDQRTEFGRSLTERAKERAKAKYLTVQFVEDQCSATADSRLTRQVGEAEDRMRVPLRDPSGPRI